MAGRPIPNQDGSSGCFFSGDGLALLVMLVSGNGDLFPYEIFNFCFFTVGTGDFHGGREGDGLFADFEFFLLLVIGGDFAGDRNLDAATGVGGSCQGEREGKG